MNPEHKSVLQRLRDALRKRLNPEGPAAEALMEYLVSGTVPSTADPKQLEAESLGAKGAGLADRGEHQQALLLYEQALGLAPENAVVWANKGRSKEFLGDIDAAMACFDQAARFDPNLELHSERGRLLLHLERFEEAIRLFDRGLEQLPGKASTWYNKAYALFRLRRLPEALPCLDRTLSLHPGHIGAIKMKSVIAQALAEPVPPAPNAGQTTIGEKSDYLSAALAKAHLARQAGQLEAAEKTLRQALELYRESAAAWHGLGEVLFDKGVYDQAINCFDTELRLDPNSAVGWSCRGNALVKRMLSTAPDGAQGNATHEKMVEILTCHERAVVLDPRNAQVWMSKGAFLLLIRRAKEAIPCFERAGELGHVHAQLALTRARGALTGNS